MKYFDLHCDTIGECSNNNFPLRENNLHIDLQRAKEIENILRFLQYGFLMNFAVMMP